MIDFKDADIWIGATDMQTEGDWVWNDGTPVTLQLKDGSNLVTIF